MGSLRTLLNSTPLCTKSFEHAKKSKTRILKFPIKNMTASNFPSLSTLWYLRYLRIRIELGRARQGLLRSSRLLPGRWCPGERCRGSSYFPGTQVGAGSPKLKLTCSIACRHSIMKVNKIRNSSIVTPNSIIQVVWLNSRVHMANSNI